MMAEKEYISYEEINSECKKLAYLLAGRGFKRIIAVARGGLVPGLRSRPVSRHQGNQQHLAGQL